MQNKKYAYSAKETLNLMQALYEQHKLLTYPRTDSRYISDDVVPTLPDRLRAVMTGDYKPFAQELMRRRPLSTKYLVNNAKVTDHHAIIPTEEAPDLWQLSGPERNIYDLVVRRFLAVLMPPCAYEEVELTLRAGDHDFTAKGRIVSEPGWRRSMTAASGWRTRKRTSRRRSRRWSRGRGCRSSARPLRWARRRLRRAIRRRRC